MSINKECRFGILPGQKFNCFFQNEETKGKTYLDAKESWSFVIKYHTCNWNNPLGFGCANLDLIQDHLKKQVKTTLVYEDVAIDPQNYESPLTTIETDISEMIWLDFATTLVTELNELEFTSDNGWIFEDLKTITKLRATPSLKLLGQEMLSVKLLYGEKKTV